MPTIDNQHDKNTPAPAEALSLLEKLSKAMKSRWVAGEDYVVVTNRHGMHPFDTDVMAVLAALPQIHAALARAEAAEARVRELEEAVACTAAPLIDAEADTADLSAQDFLDLISSALAGTGEG